jgi:DNA-binding NarL/FixJ family response regulator
MQHEMGSPRVLIADDLPAIHWSVAQLLRNHFELVGSAHNGKEAIEAATTLNPDVLILDISMPLLNGFQVASRLREKDCKAKLIFLTVHDDQDYVGAAFSIGALG